MQFYEIYIRCIKVPVILNLRHIKKKYISINFLYNFIQTNFILISKNANPYPNWLFEEKQKNN